MAAIFQLSGIKKTFQLGTVPYPALRHVDLNIERGEFLALQGASGSGKSTLLNILGLVEPPSDGSIQLENDKIENKSEREITELRRHKIGFIFQTFNLIPVLSASENVEYPLLLLGISRQAAKDKARETLDHVGLLPVASHKPAQLSGGQRQRVAIARALVKSPAIILADEPTANLDSENAKAVVKLLLELGRRNKTTVVLATHDQEIAKFADRRIHLKDGAVTHAD